MHKNNIKRKSRKNKKTIVLIIGAYPLYLKKEAINVNYGAYLFILIWLKIQLYFVYIS